MTPLNHQSNDSDASELAVIYFAGGCFWGIQKLMQSIPGVVETTCGYANGTGKGKPTYESVCEGKDGDREAVRVVYDPKRVSLDALLFAFFGVIDPTRENGQGNDFGPQYQTGIYYVDPSSKQTVERIAEMERQRDLQHFAVEIKPLQRFHEAESYHQHYLDKNPSGYCHISPKKIQQSGNMAFDPVAYRRPEHETLAARLTDQQYKVTQQAATEPPFQNEFWEHSEPGIFVDVVTGEPLFSSRDKYESSCGWPSFSAALDPNALVQRKDYSNFMVRTEVRSRVGDSHLGHVFFGDFESPNGTRYCINSAALRFIPYDEMDAAGYGDLKRFVN